MSKKVCGNCEHFSHEPNTPSRGVCWYSAEFDYYVVRGEKWAGCRDWEPKRETNWQRYFGSPEKVADYFNSPSIKRNVDTLMWIWLVSNPGSDIQHWFEGDARCRLT